MGKKEFSEGIGKSIIKLQHERYEKKSLDDAEYIPIIKIVIQGILDNMAYSNASEAEVSEIDEALKQYSKDLYIQTCLNNKEKDENIEEVKKESSEYFDYIYKHEEHPY